MSETGDKIRAARQSAGLSQARLAERMRARGRNWDATTVCIYESGRHRPSIDLLRDIAVAIGCDLAELI